MNTADAKRLKELEKDEDMVRAEIIEPGSPRENGFCESFNARMRDEFLNGELFGNMHEAQVLTDRRVRYYKTIRPHSGLGDRP